jgi:integrase
MDTPPQPFDPTRPRHCAGARGPHRRARDPNRSPVRSERVRSRGSACARRPSTSAASRSGSATSSAVARAPASPTPRRAARCCYGNDNSIAGSSATARTSSCSAPSRRPSHRRFVSADPRRYRSRARRDKRGLYIAELKLLSAAVPADWRLFLELLAHTGVRIGEAIELRRDRDVILDGQPQRTVALTAPAAGTVLAAWRGRMAEWCCVSRWDRRATRQTTAAWS